MADLCEKLPLQSVDSYKGFLNEVKTILKKSFIGFSGNLK